jgi:hypothetical protein
MRLEEFISIRKQKMLNLIFEDGIFLMGATENHLMVNLYALFDFYCEVSYDPLEGKTFNIKVFDSTNNLNPYLALIDLPEDLHGFYQDFQ